MNKRLPPSRRAFSGPELFMVFMFIVCASVVIINWDRGALDRARDNNCLSNVKQLGLGLGMYAADSNFRLPLGSEEWRGVFPYVKNNQIFVCPRAPERAKPPYRPDDQPGVTDYLLNPTAQADDPPGTIFAGDNAPDRHRHREWIGARADGAAAFFPASEWKSRLAEVGGPATPTDEGGGMKMGKKGADSGE
ncbi:MAG TPA: hypothetical protein VGM19_08220 [Armatimonadota bacterium]|jgi:hypothetical protein